MEPTPRIELKTCTLIELVTLVCVIEAERWAAEKLGHILRTGDKPEARRTPFLKVLRTSNAHQEHLAAGNNSDTQCTSFVNQERIRRARAHGTSPARGNGSARRNISAQR